MIDHTNQRQMPSSSLITKEKDYCDLLYAWLQCNSERAAIGAQERRIEKSKVKWLAIERDFTRVDSEGKEVKVMARKTIAKYFAHLLAQGLVIDKGDDYFYLALLEKNMANLINYNTLVKLMNVLQKNSLSIYIYLFNRFYANGQEPVIVTIKQMKDHIGIATTTTSNNIIIDDTLDILQRLGLLKYHMEVDANQKRHLVFTMVRNSLPE